MTTEEPIGHLVLRVPVFRVTESESWEIPQEYTYLAPGDAKWVCCERCLRHIPGRHGRADRFRPTARAAALRDQVINS